MKDLKELRNEVQKNNERIIFVKSRDVLLGAISESTLKRFRDSVNFTTKDTLFMKTTDTLVIRPFVTREVYRPSRFVYTEKDGDIRISLTDAGSVLAEMCRCGHIWHASSSANSGQVSRTAD